MELFKKIREGVYTVPDFVDEEAKDLIRQMLNMNASERISVREVLKHPWLQEQSQHNVSGTSQQHAVVQAPRTTTLLAAGTTDLVV